MKIDLGLTDTQIGIIQTTFFMSMALCAFPAAYLADRWSRKKAIAIMGLVWSGFTFITGLGRSFWGVIIPRSLVGIGEAGFTSGGIPMIAAAFSPKARARAMGVFSMAMPIGGAIGVVLGGYIAKTYGWRMAFYVFAVPGVILSLLALLMKDHSAVECKKDESNQKISFFSTIATLFKIPTLRWIYMGYAMQNITLFSFLTWGPAFIMRTQKIDSTQAGLIVGLISIMAIFGAVIGGFLADFWQKRNERGRMLTSAFGLLFSSIVLIISMYFNLKGIGLVFGVLWGILVVVPIPAITAVTQDVAPPSARSASWGMNAFCCYVLGGAWAPLLVGTISDNLGGGGHGLKVGLLISSIGGFVGALLYWISSKSYVADLKKIDKKIMEEEAACRETVLK
jgi:MFS family permease